MLDISQSVGATANPKTDLFNKKVEDIQKYVYRAFGVLFQRHIINLIECKLWISANMSLVSEAAMKTHNEIIKYRHGRCSSDRTAELSTYIDPDMVLKDVVFLEKFLCMLSS